MLVACPANWFTRLTRGEWRCRCTHSNYCVPYVIADGGNYTDTPLPDEVEPLHQRQWILAAFTEAWVRAALLSRTSTVAYRRYRNENVAEDAGDGKVSRRITVHRTHKYCRCHLLAASTLGAETSCRYPHHPGRVKRTEGPDEGGAVRWSAQTKRNVFCLHRS